MSIHQAAITDNFTRANSLDLGTSWINTVNLQIVSNKVRPEAVGEEGAEFWPNQKWADAWVSMSVVTANPAGFAGTKHGLFLRMASASASADGYRVYLFRSVDLGPPIADQIALYKNVSGTPTTLYTTPLILQPALPVVFSMEIVGSTITVYYNGVAVITYIDASITAPGYAGFGVSVYDTTTVADAEVDDVSLGYFIDDVCVNASVDAHVIYVVEETDAGTVLRFPAPHRTRATTHVNGPDDTWYERCVTYFPNCLAQSKLLLTSEGLLLMGTSGPQAGGVGDFLPHGAIVKSSDRGVSWTTAGTASDFVGTTSDHTWDGWHPVDLGNNVIMLAGGFMFDDTESPYYWPFLRSTNNGRTFSRWTPASLTADTGLSDFDSLTGASNGAGVAVFSVSNTGKIIRTTDYGLTWAVVHNPATAGNLEDMIYIGGSTFVGAGHAFVTGKRVPRIYLSTDLGATWNIYPDPATWPSGYNTRFVALGYLTTESRLIIGASVTPDGTDANARQFYWSSDGGVTINTSGNYIDSPEAPYPGMDPAITTKRGIPIQFTKQRNGYIFMTLNRDVKVTYPVGPWPLTYWGEVWRVKWNAGLGYPDYDRVDIIDARYEGCRINGIALLEKITGRPGIPKAPGPGLCVPILPALCPETILPGVAQ